MKKLPPFLPGFSSKLQGSPRRRQLEILREKRDEAIDSSMAELGALFHDILPAEWLASITSDIRECIFTQTVVFWAWLSQFLEQNESCVRALALVEGWCKTNGESRPTFDTSAYCRARLRLPDEFLDEVHKKIESFAEARVEGHHLWHGLRLKAIDGTSVKLMDTPENQAAYPQPPGQAAGCGFPVMGVVGVLDPARGTLSDYITCDHRQHDIKGFYKLRGHFKPGDLAVGDRAFCSYELLALLKEVGAESIMRLHQRRDAKGDWKRGIHLDTSLKDFAGLLRHPRRLAEALSLFEECLRERIIPIRPGRQEPRAVKTRPKSYQYMTKPRHEFTEIQHRGKYRKAA